MNDSQPTKISRRQFSKVIVAGVGMIASWKMNIFSSVASLKDLKTSAFGMRAKISGEVYFPNPK